jgi:thymidylate synthase
MAKITESTPNSTTFLKMYADLAKGKICMPRNQKILEVEDYQMVLDAGDSCITSFKARKLNFKYAVNELIWYIKADPYDTSIEKYASMWPKIKQPEGFYYSNYGQYMFAGGGGIKWAIEELTRDKDSRRAAFPFLNRKHCFADNKDMVCTYAMSFRIREDKLNMSVSMRSNDAIFGLTNDVFCFWMVHKMVFAILKRAYPDLKIGRYTHKVDSLHVYERHWSMLNELINGGEKDYYTVFVPDPDHMSAWRCVYSWDDALTFKGNFAEWLIRVSQET